MSINILQSITGKFSAKIKKFSHMEWGLIFKRNQKNNLKQEFIVYFLFKSFYPIQEVFEFINIYQFLVDYL